jgi:hypothetical protein
MRKAKKIAENICCIIIYQVKRINGILFSLKWLMFRAKKEHKDEREIFK